MISCTFPCSAAGPAKMAQKDYSPSGELRIGLFQTER
jgi:hypothetical protein